MDFSWTIRVIRVVISRRAGRELSIYGCVLRNSISGIVVVPNSVLDKALFVTAPPHYGFRG